MRWDGMLGACNKEIIKGVESDILSNGTDEEANSLWLSIKNRKSRQTACVYLPSKTVMPLLLPDTVPVNYN